jgi:hypothetical protein
VIASTDFSRSTVASGRKVQPTPVGGLAEQARVPVALPPLRAAVTSAAPACIVRPYLAKAWWPYSDTHPSAGHRRPLNGSFTAISLPS